MDLTLFLQQFLNGLSIGSVYAIFALGYTLVFSILGIINFAHGAVFTLGAYFTYALMGGAGLVGVIVERVAFLPLRRRNSDPLLTVVSSLGAAVAIANIIQYLVGAEIYTFPANTYGNLPAAINFGTADQQIPIRTVQIVIFVVAVAIVSLLTYLINFTKFGKAMQAVAEDATTSSLLGIDTDRYIVLTFFVSSFLAGLAGSLVGSSVSIAGPYFGIAFGLKGLAVIVLGGLGSIPGAVFGGFIIGLVEAFVPGDFSAYKDAVAFAILFIMLLVRPQGLFGRRLIQKV
ncbi:MAG: branched-chain amino acid ABC transporter permease [Oscillatoriales cyanobacterium]|nr:MAG: branched-chain amino acid ABC transporter permease [Oscillatoriales cyanobacterium]